MSRTLTRALIALVLLTAATGSVQGAGDDRSLPAPVRKALAKAGLKEKGLSIWVRDITAKAPLLTLNEDVPRNPASVMKLVTTAAALQDLGPAYRWKTRAYATGPIRGGRLEGDLVLVGEGDPFLVTESFWTFLRGLRETGLREIGGNLLIDDGFFAPEPHDPGDFDDKPYRAYNAQPSALLVNFNATDFRFRPDRESNRVVITPDPPNASLRIDNDLKLTPGPCRGAKYRIRMQVLAGSPRTTVRFWGNYPAACGRYELLRTVFASHPDYVGGVFRALWEQLGGTLEGEVKHAGKPPDAKLLHSAYSQPLAELIRPMNKFSNNVMTRNLFLTFAAERFGPPGTEEKGRTAVADWLSQAGIDPAGLRVDNGAGLSRTARVTARSLGEMLLAVRRGPWMAEFVSSLPLAAMDGTMRRRFRASDLEGRMHLKTGLINHVRAIAGYVLTRRGHTFVIVMLHNEKNVHHGSGTVVQDALLEWLYDQ